MKQNLLKFSAAFLLLAACNSSPYNNETHFIPNKGQNVDSMKTPIVEDKLNNSVFSVKLIADSNGRPGVYNVCAVSGFNTANSMFTMPKGAEKSRPVIHKRNGLYAYIVGFHIPNDTTFYEYYEINSANNTITMRYVKSYTFE